MAINKIEDLKVGQYYEKEFIVTEDIGAEFARISKDFNPIHLDECIARKSRFNQKIVHGMLLGSYISGIIGNEFPGEGSVYLNQEFSFRRPVYYNVPIIVKVEIIEIDLAKKHIMLETVCMNGEKDILIKGKALILLEN
ncbi:MAG: MaoC family dehydratase [Lachnospiraceae bacterium]|nr:MaoC family dehydratase [Lachnospiraceae bacterium]